MGLVQCARTRASTSLDLLAVCAFLSLQPYANGSGNGYSNGYSNGNDYSRGGQDFYGGGAGGVVPSLGMETRDVRPKSTAGFLPTAEYMRQQDLQVQGSNVPEPFQTFESVGFPADILDEVRCSCLADKPPSMPELQLEGGGSL